MFFKDVLPPEEKPFTPVELPSPKRSPIMPRARNTVEGLRFAVDSRTRTMEDLHDLCEEVRR